MTAAERQAARERCDKATPGPWSDDPLFGPSSVTPKRLKPITFGGKWDDGDRSFVIAARTDLPDALDALAEKDQRIAELESDKERMLESLQNCKGLFDTPVERRRRSGDSCYSEAMAQLRDTLEALSPPEVS